MAAPEKIVLADPPARPGPGGPAPVAQGRRPDPGHADGAGRVADVDRRRPTASTAGSNYLATGITTDRVPEDDIVVPAVHFTKANGELTSVSVDENTKVVRA